MQKLYSVFNRLYFYLFLGLLIFIPLYPKIPLASVQGTYVAIRFDDIFIAVVLALWLVLNFKKLRSLLTKNITLSVLLFWAIGLISLFSAVYVTFSVSPHLALLNWARRVETMSLLFVGWTTVQSKKQLKIILFTMLIVTVLLTLYGFGQVFVHLPVISTSNREFSKGLVLQLTPGARPNSTFAGAYDLAIYISMFLMYIGALFFFYRRLFQKALIAISGGISFVLMGMTAARTSFAATVLGLAVIFWVVGKRMLIAGLILASIVGIAAVPSLRHRLVDTWTVNILHQGGAKYVAPLPTASPSGTARLASPEATKSASTSALPVGIAAGEPINTTELDVSRSVNIRTNVEWPRALHAFYKNPLLGTGYSSLNIATDNDFLRSLGEVGLLGSIGLAVVLWAITKELWGSLKSSDRLIRFFTIGTIVMIFGFLMNGVFIDVFESSKVAEIFWLMLGVNLAMRRLER